MPEHHGPASSASAPTPDLHRLVACEYCDALYERARWNPANAPTACAAAARCIAKARAPIAACCRWW
jgi:hypothetical protein